MNNITNQTRKESYSKLDTNTKRKLIYEELGQAELTARELATKMYKNKLIETPSRQEIAPRLTELEKLEKIEVIKKKYDEKSNCRVAVYKRKEGNKNEIKR